MANNRIILIIIAVFLGIIAFVAIEQYHNQTPAEKLSSSINEVKEEIKDEIDDHTTSK